MNEDRQIVVVGGHQSGKSVAAAMMIATAQAAGMRVVQYDPEKHGRHITGYWENEADSLMDYIPPDVAFYQGQTYYRHQQPVTRLSQTPHIDTPKPVSKRRARRLRGKAERKAS